LEDFVAFEFSQSTLVSAFAAQAAQG